MNEGVISVVLSGQPARVRLGELPLRLESAVADGFLNLSELSSVFVDFSELSSTSSEIPQMRSTLSSTDAGTDADPAEDQSLVCKLHEFKGVTSLPYSSRFCACMSVNGELCCK